MPNRSFLAAKNPAGNLLLTTKYDIVHYVLGSMHLSRKFIFQSFFISSVCNKISCNFEFR